MADHYSEFASFIPCASKEQAETLAQALRDTFTDDESISECYYEEHLGNPGVYIADQYGSIPEAMPEVIRKHLAENDPGRKVIISGNYGCSKLRVDEFGGWAVGITKDVVEWVDAHSYMRDFLDR